MGRYNPFQAPRTSVETEEDRSYFSKKLVQTSALLGLMGMVVYRAAPFDNEDYNEYALGWSLVPVIFLVGGHYVLRMLGAVSSLRKNSSVEEREDFEE